MAIIATVVAIPAALSTGADSSGEGILAIELSASDASTGSTSVPESTSSSLFSSGSSQSLGGAQLFRAGALVEVPDGQTATTQAPRDEESSEVEQTTSTVEISATSTVPPTTRRSTTTVAPTTAAPTTAAPTTAAPTTVAPTTAAPTTVAPTTAAPTTVAPTTAPDSTTTPTSQPGSAPTAEQWAQLRACESGGNYSIVNSSGRYFGAYQFGIGTWDSVAASSGRSDLVGVKPNVASAADQDAMALALWQDRGPAPWPHCGKYLPPKP